jgi:hypothetical protein
MKRRERSALGCAPVKWLSRAASQPKLSLGENLYLLEALPGRSGRAFF